MITLDEALGSIFPRRFIPPIQGPSWHIEEIVPEIRVCGHYDQSQIGNAKAEYIDKSASKIITLLFWNGDIYKREKLFAKRRRCVILGDDGRIYDPVKGNSKPDYVRALSYEFVDMDD